MLIDNAANFMAVNECRAKRQRIENKQTNKNKRTMKDEGSFFGGEVGVFRVPFHMFW